MGMSGDFNDFHWEADINEDELEDLSESVEVTVTTPTGGTISFSMWGPWEDVGVFEQILIDDVEVYLDVS